MATKTVAAHTDEKTANEVEELGEDRDLSNSQAANRALQAGLGRLGYRDEGHTPGQEIAYSAATGLWFAAVTMLALSALGSIALQYASVTTLFGSLGVFASAKVAIPRVEPGLTNRLPKIEVSRYGR